MKCLASNTERLLIIDNEAIGEAINFIGAEIKEEELAKEESQVKIGNVLVMNLKVPKGNNDNEMIQTYIGNVVQEIAKRIWNTTVYNIKMKRKKIEEIDERIKEIDKKENDRCQILGEVILEKLVGKQNRCRQKIKKLKNKLIKLQKKKEKVKREILERTKAESLYMKTKFIYEAEYKVVAIRHIETNKKRITIKIDNNLNVDIEME